METGDNTTPAWASALVASMNEFCAEMRKEAALTRERLERIAAAVDRNTEAVQAMSARIANLDREQGQ